MKCLVKICTLLLSLPLVWGQICWKNVSVPYVKWGHTYVSQQSRCDFKCWGKWKQSMIDSSYSTSTCALAFNIESVPECCEGYAKDPRGECKPVCEGGCTNGACNGPNRCDCDVGFQVQGNRCVPVCDPECLFGVCSERGQCTCLPGYTNLTDTECVPVCDPPCENGRCIAPNTCECSYGFEKSLESDYLCLPKCDPEIADCGNGTCVGPNRCLCEEGFVFRGLRCVPQCDAACINGDCTKPNTCTCREGFSTSAAYPNVCVPVCESGCPNGTCVAPNTCQCTLGYNATSTDPNLCEPSCDPTYMDINNGQCIAPNVLRCNEGFKLEHSSQASFMKCRSIIEADPKIPSLTDLLITDF